MKPIAGFACYPPTDTPLARDAIPFKPVQLRVPARHTRSNPSPISYLTPR